MLAPLICLILFLCFLGSTVNALSDNHSNNWKVVAHNSWAQILVEDKLYRKANEKPFFAHIEIKNKSKKAIAFDFGRRSLFFINQWCQSDVPQRNIVDETRLNTPVITKKDTQYLIDTFNGKKPQSLPANRVSLLKLKPGKTYDYYIAFNNGSYADVSKSRTRYVILVIDGHMIFTDGKNLQVLERDENEENLAEVPIAVIPDFWGRIPHFAKTFVY